MSHVDEKEFNSVFISHAHEDKDFAQQFRDKLQEKLGDSPYVWIDDYLLEGKEWRREIQKRLNSTALVVVILSPKSTKSPWVIYEWDYSLLVQQSEPFLVHFRECDCKELRRFTDYQIRGPLFGSSEQFSWNNRETEISKTLDAVAARLRSFPKLKERFETLTNISLGHADQQKAAYELGQSPEGLRLAAANYLIKALQFWMSHGVYGPVGMSIANELGRLGKRKAIPSLVQFFLSQANGQDMYMPALNSVQRALSLLSYEEPI